MGYLKDEKYFKSDLPYPIENGFIDGQAIIVKYFPEREEDLIEEDYEE